MSAARILLVEDEEHLALGIRENLEAEGHAVEWVADGLEGARAIVEGEFELAILDVMLPGCDGYAICEAARGAGRGLPILFLTARGEVSDRITGFERGGDDYLPKPFHLRELLLRVGSLLRRGSTTTARRVVEFGGNTVDLDAGHAIDFRGVEHHLPPREAAVLDCLVGCSGEVVTREDVLDAVWGSEPRPSTRVVSELLERLRARLERDPSQPQHIHTERGIGYRFTP